jgi:hypothetical protein
VLVLILVKKESGDFFVGDICASEDCARIMLGIIGWRSDSNRSIKITPAAASPHSAKSLQEYQVKVAENDLGCVVDSLRQDFVCEEALKLKLTR